MGSSKEALREQLAAEDELDFSAEVRLFADDDSDDDCLERRRRIRRSRRVERDTPLCTITQLESLREKK